MASLLSIMPPSTDCSAARSCGGCFSNAPADMPRSSVSATERSPPRPRVRPGVRILTPGADESWYCGADTQGYRRARWRTVGPSFGLGKRPCGQLCGDRVGSCADHADSLPDGWG